MTEVAIPLQKEFYNPTLRALHNLGGSASNQEILDEVVKVMPITDEQFAIPWYKRSSGAIGGGITSTRIGHRVAWALTHLKQYGLITNISRGLWTLTEKGRNTEWMEPDDVVRTVQQMVKEGRARKRNDTLSRPEAVDDSFLDTEDGDWRDDLLALLHQMDPSAFERLFQRVLRQDGFYQVDVTGRSGDGGIDGIGVIRVSGFLSFRVLFQCKRYKGSIGAGVVRDFRGAMVGRTDKGLIVTTGNFTPASRKEATRDGAPEIDLIDGEQLIDKLKELSLGVKTEVVEQVIIDKEWFQRI